ETYWCGDPASLSHVLAHLDGFELRRLGIDRTVRPAGLTREETEQLRDRLRADPTRWTAQVPARFSTAPTLVPGPGVDERQVGLRTFAVAHQSGYVVMPGALGRVVRDD